MGLRRRRVIAFLWLFSIFLNCSFTSSVFSVSLQGENSSLLKFEVTDAFIGNLRHIIQISNPTSSRVVGGKLSVPIVRNETLRHHVILYNISASIGNPTISIDGSGNIYAHWSSITIDGKQTFTVELSYQVFSFGTRYLINSSLIADYDPSSYVYVKYTQAEGLIESNDAKIISKAQDLIENESNIHEKVYRIYSFVVRHMRYSSQEFERGALWALENGLGDCSEYSYLFVALCRAAGIPTRIQAGFAFHSQEETLEDGHMWAEYYLDNYGWIPVDATWRLFDEIDYRHFSSIQTTPDFIEGIYTNYVFDYSTGPDVDEEQHIILEPSSTNVFGDSFAENFMKTVQKVKQAKSALLLAKVLGATSIFSSEATKAQETLLESQIILQNAISLWEANPQLAQSNVADALEGAEKAMQSAWILIAKTLITFIAILVVPVVISLIFVRRRQTK